MGYWPSTLKNPESPTTTQKMLTYSGSKLHEIETCQCLALYYKQKLRTSLSQIGETRFKCSTGWLDRFIDRHGITFKKVCSESRSVDVKSKDMTEWAELKTLLSEFNLKDIFNANETGLCFHLLPDKVLDFKGSDSN